MNRIRNSRRVRFSEGFPVDSYALERRELMASNLLLDVNKSPQATLAFDGGVTQFYDQGDILMAVSAGRAVEALDENELPMGFYAYGNGYAFEQVGETTLIFTGWTYSDSDVTLYRYQAGASSAEFVRSWSGDLNIYDSQSFLIESGEHLIFRNRVSDGEVDAFSIYDRTAGDFVPIGAPVPGSTITDVDPLPGGRFLVMAEKDGSSSGHYFDPETSQYATSTIIAGAAAQARVILDAAAVDTSLVQIAGQLYLANGVSQSEKLVGLGDSGWTGNEMTAVRFGSQIFVGTSESGYLTSEPMFAIYRFDAAAENPELIPSVVSQPGDFDFGTYLSVRIEASANSLMAVVSENDFYEGFARGQIYQAEIGSLEFDTPYAFTGSFGSIEETGTGGLLLFVTNWTGDGYDTTILGTGIHGIQHLGEISESLTDVMPTATGALLLTSDGPGKAKIRSLDTLSGTLDDVMIIRQRLANLGYLEPASNYYLKTPRGLIVQAGNAEFGVEAWITDGTEAGTHPLVDLVPGPGSSGANAFRHVEDGVEFVANGPDGKNRVYRYLWATGEVVPGAEVRETNNGSSGYVGMGVNFNVSAKVNDRLLFTAFDGNSLALFATDGTPSGTAKIDDSIIAGTLATRGDKVFYLRDTSSGSELRITDGTVEGAEILATFPANAEMLYGDSVNQLGSHWPNDPERVLIRTSDASGRMQFWISDGTTAGTRAVYTVDDADASLIFGANLSQNDLVIPLRKDAAGTTEIRSVDVLTGEVETLFTTSVNLYFKGSTASGLVYFEFSDYENGLGLIVTDGTVEGTRTVDFPEELNPNDYDRYVSPTGVVLVPTIYTSVDKSLIWIGTSPSGDFVPFDVTESTGPGVVDDYLQTIDGSFFFKFHREEDGAQVDEIWRTDGTSAGTNRILSSANLARGFQDDQAYLTKSADLIMLSLVNWEIDETRTFFVDDDGQAQLVEGAGIDAKPIGKAGDRGLFHMRHTLFGEEPHYFSLASESLAIEPIPDVVIDEHGEWSLPVIATTTHTATLEFSLASDAPTGMSIDPVTGVIRWTPSETDGGRTFPVTVKARTTSGPELFAERTFGIVVRETNSAPSLGPISNFVISENVDWSFQVQAEDPDRPYQSLRFAFVSSAPNGMTIDPVSGIIRWKPDESFGGQTLTVRVRVTDDSDQPLSDEKSFTIGVLETNEPPAIAAIEDRQIFEGQRLDFRVQGTDGDLPAQSLSYRLTGDVPAGASIDPVTGQFVWQTSFGSVSHRFTVEVRDTGSPAKSAAASFNVQVRPLPLQISRYLATMDRRRRFISSIGIEFGSAVDVRTGGRAANYGLVMAGRDGQFGTRDDRTVRIRTVQVGRDRKSVQLRPMAPLAVNRSYRLTVLDNVLDSLGRKLDGDRDGAFGGSASVNLVLGQFE